MKGFIELHCLGGAYSVNISKIVSFGEQWIYMQGNECQSTVSESYEEIKSLIKSATEVNNEK